MQGVVHGQGGAGGAGGARAAKPPAPRRCRPKTRKNMFKRIWQGYDRVRQGLRPPPGPIWDRFWGLVALLRTIEFLLHRPQPDGPPSNFGLCM